MLQITILGLPRNELIVHSAEKEKEKSTTKEKFSIISKTEKSGKLLTTASVTTAKTTLGHSATLTARDTAYEVNLLDSHFTDPIRRLIRHIYILSQMDFFHGFPRNKVIVTFPNIFEKELNACVNTR